MTNVEIIMKLKPLRFWKLYKILGKILSKVIDFGDGYKKDLLQGQPVLLPSVSPMFIYNRPLIYRYRVHLRRFKAPRDTPYPMQRAYLSARRLTLRDRSSNPERAQTYLVASRACPSR